MEEGTNVWLRNKKYEWDELGRDLAKGAWLPCKIVTKTPVSKGKAGVFQLTIIHDPELDLPPDTFQHTFMYV